MTERVLLDITIDIEAYFKKNIPMIIDGIAGTEQAQWGIMTVHHMVEHLLFPLQFLLSKEPLVLLTAPEKLQRQLDFLHSNLGMPINYKTPFLPIDKTVQLKHSNLFDSKEDLKNTIIQFLNSLNQPDFSTKMHPVFGELNKQEWLLFQYKHFSHHFMQFGLI